jgi:hypothetical protein
VSGGEGQVVVVAHTKMQALVLVVVLAWSGAALQPSGTASPSSVGLNCTLISPLSFPSLKRCLIQCQPRCYHLASYCEARPCSPQHEQKKNAKRHWTHTTGVCTCQYAGQTEYDGGGL